MFIIIIVIIFHYYWQSQRPSSHEQPGGQSEQAVPATYIEPPNIYMGMQFQYNWRNTTLPVSTLGIVADDERLVPGSLLIVDHATAELFSVCPDHLGVVTSTVAEPGNALSEMKVGQKHNNYTNGSISLMLNPGLSTSLYLKENTFLNSIQLEEVELQ